LPKIKIIESGWSNFTGNFGGVEFVDGVSVGDVSESLCDRIACSIRMESVETGLQVGIQQRLIDNATVRAEVIEALETAENEPVTSELKEPHKKEVMHFYTEDELDLIVEENGINGLRNIGNKLNVKARSIPELIADILRAQSDIKAKIATETQS
jgi:hypothetical protein